MAENLWYLWLWLQLVYGPFDLVGGIKAGVLESKLIVPVLLPVLLCLFRLDWLIQFKLYFVHWLFIQTIDVWYKAVMRLLRGNVVVRY